MAVDPGIRYLSSGTQPSDWYRAADRGARRVHLPVLTRNCGWTSSRARISTRRSWRTSAAGAESEHSGSSLDRCRRCRNGSFD